MKRSPLLYPLTNKTTMFYLLAFVPFVVMVFLNVFGLVIPILGFLLLYLKEEELPFDHRTNLVEKAFGIVIMVGSFFLHYVWASFVSPGISLYNVTNYIVYIFGLCFVFFGLRSLKSAFTPIFLMVAASSNTFVSRWIEPYLSSYAVSAVTETTYASLRILGIPAMKESPNILILQTSNGQRFIPIVWDCVGIHSLLIFAALLVVVFLEETSPLRTKLLWAVFGVIGTIAVNFVRVTLIIVTIYLYGIEIGGIIHFSIGYIFFFMWLGLFFYLFSRKEAIAAKLHLSAPARATC